MNHYPWWKNLMVVLVVAVGGLLALPNLFGEDPSIQIARDDYQPVAESTVTRVRELLQRENLVNRGVFDRGRPGAGAFRGGRDPTPGP